MKYQIQRRFRNPNPMAFYNIGAPDADLFELAARIRLWQSIHPDDYFQLVAIIDLPEVLV